MADSHEPAAETAAVPIARFATDQLPPQGRYELIREFYGRISIGLDVDPREDIPLEMAVSSAFLPGVIASLATTTPLKWERRADLMVDGNDDVCIAWASNGYMFGRPGRSDLEIATDTALLTSLDRRWTAETFGTSWKINAQIERRLLADRVRGLDDAAPDRISRRSSEGALLFDYQWSLARLPVTAAMAPRVAEHLVDLVALALGPTADARHAAQEGGVRAARLLALKRYVASNLHRSTLSARSAAHALRISERYVRSLFAGEGTSFSDFVAERRLDAIRHCLLQPAQASRPIADIAADLGFDEPSTFYRRFKARFGVSPSDLRRR